MKNAKKMNISTIHEVKFYNAIRGKSRQCSPVNESDKNTRLGHLANPSSRIDKINPDNGHVSGQKAMNIWRREHDADRGIKMLFYIAIILLLFAGTSLNAQDLKAVKCDSGTWVKENDQNILFYRQAPVSHEGNYTRNHYIHPLYGMSGEILTEDFPADHLHQRGIYWAWHQVLINGKAMGNMWKAEDFVWDVQNVQPYITSNQLVLKSHVLWKSPRLADNSGKNLPFMKEKSRIIVYPIANDMRIIDFRIQLKPLQDNLKIGGSDNDKGYGGFSARLKLPDNIRFIAEYGQVIPKRTAVPSSPWMDFTGNFGPGTSKSGILILSHPSNPHHPPRWIIRKNRSMQNPVYPGKDPINISQNKPLNLKYRLIIHKKEFSRETIKKLYHDYEHQ